MTSLTPQTTPLQQGDAIADAKGAATPAFLRRINTLWKNVQTLLNAANAAQATASAAVPQTRLINTTAPIAGGGNLSADLTLSHAVSGVTASTYGDGTHVPQLTVDADGHLTAVTNVAITGGGTGTVTTTGTPASGELVFFSGATSITNGDLSGDVTTSGTGATTIGNAKVTLAKIANASANSVLLGSGAAGSGSSYVEITLGTNLSMSGTTLNASGGGGTGANPTATASDTAVNGVATTFMRSDAAPAVQKASSSQFGLVKVDGTTITEAAGVISAPGGSSGGLVRISEQSPSGTGVVSFTSIPSTYRDLLLVVRGRGTAVATVVNLVITLNGDSGTNYDRERLSALNSTTVSALGGGGNTDLFGSTPSLPAANATANLAGVFEATIYDYKGTTFSKIAMGLSAQDTGTSGTTITMSFITGFWRPSSPAAVNRIDIALTSGNFVSGSVVTLYGRN